MIAREDLRLVVPLAATWERHVKYAIIVPDGMADEPLERLGGRTPLEAAATPHMDRVAAEGRLGLTCHTPPSLPPGSDVALLSVLGYDATTCYTGRAPLEAASMGIELAPGEMAFRCNLVTVDEGRMADHSAGNISTPEGAALIALLDRALREAPPSCQPRFDAGLVTFHPGVGYRHLMVYHGGEPIAPDCTPPHDIIGQPIAKHGPRGKGGDLLSNIMQWSEDVLAGTDINEVRLDLGENPANRIWLWGGGTKPQLEPFRQRFGKTASVIAAVDLVKGIAISLGLDAPHVEGATGYLNTDYAAKGQAAIAALAGHDLVVVHVEAPDEAGHTGDIQGKVDAIEAVDKHVVGPLHDALAATGHYRLLVLPDHPTPIALRTHVSRPVPFALCGTDIAERSHAPYTEAAAAATGLVVEPGHRLMSVFLGDDRP